MSHTDFLGMDGGDDEVLDVGMVGGKAKAASSSSSDKRVPKTFCNIMKFLEVHDRQFYDTILTLCMSPLLVPKPGSSVTFLLPKDKSVRDKIMESAYGSNTELAQKMIKACIIFKRLLPSEFGNHAISNALKQKINVLGVDSSEKIKIGKKESDIQATLVQNKQFKLQTRGDKKENAIIYDMTGEIGINGETVSDSKSQKGGAYVINQSLAPEALCDNDTRDMCSFIESRDFAQNVYVERTLSFFKWVANERGGVDKLDRDLLGCVKAVPEHAYVCVINYCIRNRDVYEKWISDTAGLYAATNEMNVMSDYLAFYEEVAKSSVVASTFSARVPASTSTGSLVDFIRQLYNQSAVLLWQDSVGFELRNTLVEIGDAYQATGSYQSMTTLIAAFQILRKCAVKGPAGDGDWDKTILRNVSGSSKTMYGRHKNIHMFINSSLSQDRPESPSTIAGYSSVYTFSPIDDDEDEDSEVLVNIKYVLYNSTSSRNFLARIKRTQLAKLFAIFK
jgi:hypothetical protein